MVERLADICFDFLLTDDPTYEYALDVDQVFFRGSGSVEEVVFFHRDSKTLLAGDVIQRPSDGWRQWIFGSEYYTPPGWRLSFWWNAQEDLAKNALQKITTHWKLEQLVLVNGPCDKENATNVVIEGAELDSYCHRNYSVRPTNA